MRYAKIEIGMGKPRSEVSDKLYFRDVRFFYEAFASLKNVEEAKIFIKDIVTKSELRMLKRRWHIAGLLLEGHDIRSVASKTKTSTQTVSRVKRILEEGHGGLLTALERIKKAENRERTRIGHGSKYVKDWFRK